MSYTKGHRYSIVPGEDNKYSIPRKEILAPAYAATLNIVAQSADSEEIQFRPAQLTGALTLTADVNTPFAGDKLVCAFACDGTGRTVTFSTGFIVNTSTLALNASKVGNIVFNFSGQAQAWVEVSRFIQS